MNAIVKSSGNIKDVTWRATQFIEQEFDWFDVTEDVIRNEIAKLQFGED